MGNHTQETPFSWAPLLWTFVNETSSPLKKNRRNTQSQGVDNKGIYTRYTGVSMEVSNQFVRFKSYLGDLQRILI